MGSPVQYIIPMSTKVGGQWPAWAAISLACVFPCRAASVKMRSSPGARGAAYALRTASPGLKKTMRHRHEFDNTESLNQEQTRRSLVSCSALRTAKYNSRQCMLRSSDCRDVSVARVFFLSCSPTYLRSAKVPTKFCDRYE